MQDLVGAPTASGHFLLETESMNPPQNGLYLIASPHLDAESRDLEAVLRTCYHPEENCVKYIDRYILVLRPTNALIWVGLCSRDLTSSLDVAVWILEN